ncbi:MAG: hypothetical protein E7541_02440 [Ruminococcaceae bacterium]|nr:hypothetical protein [Oscillospiraceae bacterium]
MDCKVYVEVTASFLPDGGVMPLAVRWEDGTLYQVDRVLDVRPAASLKAGGCGIRYTCRIRGQQTYLFLDADRWFVEKKEKPAHRA